MFNNNNNDNDNDNNNNNNNNNTNNQYTTARSYLPACHSKPVLYTLDTRPGCLRSHPLWGDYFSLRGAAGLEWRANLNGRIILRG
eukprot:1095255-Pyramimonas_sp.AAC.1